MIRCVSTVWSCLLLVGFMAHGAEGQVLYTLESPNPEDRGRFGYSVSGAGDVDNDGYNDVVVGAYYEGARDPGRAYIFSGQARDLLWTLESPNPEEAGRFGCSVSGAGDVNNDGCDDVVVGARWEDGGAPGAGRAYVFSGQTGSPLWTLQSPNPEFWFGYSVSGAGDVNSDGFDDVVVGAPGEDGGAYRAGRAYIFSGQTGNLLYTLESAYPEPEGLFGLPVSAAGDVNNDGYPDVVVAAAYEDGGAPDAGRAYIFSGQTGDLLWILVSPNAGYACDFGFSVSGAGDTNNDGYDDVVVGAPFENGGAFDAGRAYIFSGQTGGVLWTLQSPGPQDQGFFGWSVAGAGDVDNDGYSDVVVGAVWEDGGEPYAGRAHIFGGQTGNLLWILQSANPEIGGWFGYSVSDAGDVNGAGYDDVLVATPHEDAGAYDAGRAYVFAPVDVPVEFASLRAEPQGGAVRLVWVTLTEQDNLGFNVERAEDQRAPFVRLNDKLIPGAGTTTVPHSYSYLDATVEAGVTYWYRLEDVSLAGQRTLHGPITVFVPSLARLGLELLAGSEPAFALSFAEPGHASLKLYDVAGRLAATLWQGDGTAGTTIVRPDGSGTRPSGLYTAILAQNGHSIKRRVTMLR